MLGCASEGFPRIEHAAIPEDGGMMMHKIKPHLWFDKEAKEAAQFYTSAFKESRIVNVSTLHNTPSGDCDVVSFELIGQPFMAISAGPLFKFNPSVSFLVACKTKQEVDALWQTLSAGGTPLMPLDKYPFSEWYAWIQDKYGLSWQIMFFGDWPITQNIIPTLMFVGKVCGKAEEAMNFYAKVFKNAKIVDIARYEKGQEPDQPGTVTHGRFTLEGQEFAAMDSARMHDFAFNEAISFMVNCKTQDEIDYYWEKLSAVPEAEQCGWLKDSYGVSWQITPEVLGTLMQGDQKKIDRVTEAVLKMKKFDIKKLEQASGEA
jgi:predicted 3-demethylubiquinone-9 3-methyltransferase (glyoxalase superfamily)